MVGGCTSVSWVSDDGEVHHAGLVLCRTSPMLSGTRFERWTLGSDLRLTGPDAGWTFGFKRHEFIRPLDKAFEIPSEPGRETDLPDELITDMLDGPTAEDGELESPSWDLFYSVEYVSPMATYVRADSFGLDIRTGQVSPGLSALYHGNVQLIGRAIESNKVHVLWPNPESGELDHAVLWTLISESDENLLIP